MPCIQEAVARHSGAESRMQKAEMEMPNMHDEESKSNAFAAAPRKKPKKASVDLPAALKNHLLLLWISAFRTSKQFTALKAAGKVPAPASTVWMPELVWRAVYDNFQLWMTKTFPDRPGDISGVTYFAAWDMADSPAKEERKKEVESLVKQILIKERAALTSPKSEDEKLGVQTKLLDLTVSPAAVLLSNVGRAAASNLKEKQSNVFSSAQPAMAFASAHSSGRKRRAAESAEDANGGKEDEYSHVATSLGSRFDHEGLSDDEEELVCSMHLVGGLKKQLT